MFPPSYLVIPLLCTLRYPKIAALFYPYVFITSIIGILFLLYNFIYPHKNIKYESTMVKLLGLNDEQIFYWNMFIILAKIFVLFIWPISYTNKAFVYSLSVFILYAIMYLSFYKNPI